jgi:hypothetical protein
MMAVHHGRGFRLFDNLHLGLDELDTGPDAIIVDLEAAYAVGLNALEV